jgi:spermidine synthase
MLLVVLLGIGSGGLASSLWLRFQRNAYRFFPLLAFAAGVLVLWTYTGFEGAPVSNRESILGQIPETFWLSFRLMFPVSFLSGILFTFNGRAVYDSVGEEMRTVGWITLSNTLGAMLGAMLGAWWLLPKLGLENSIFALALLYAAIALAAPKLYQKETMPRMRPAFIVAAVVMLVSAVAYPFGLMRNHFVPLVTSTYATANTSVLGYREGLTETIIYTQDHWFGEPYYNRMLTNAYSMSSTDLLGQRYMKHFVFWPLAFHPVVEDALLISYGVGSTAKALTESKEIRHIDIVDISRDVLETNHYIFPNQQESPLQDPRVKVYIEDGRFFLLTSKQEYDLITGEPPPLMISGVVNLYTQEYFELLHGRLKEGGYTTYWLPVEQLSESDTKAVIAGFCNVFDDCSLWRGAGLQLVLVGSKNATGRIEESRFRRQWNDQAVLHELRVLGFETPELMLTTFVGDAPYLRSLTADADPLVDNYPHRLGRQLSMDLDFHYGVVANEKSAERYRNSTYLKKLLPPALFEAGSSSYRYQALIDDCLDAYPNPRPIPLSQLHMILTETDLRTPALWLLGDTGAFSGVIEKLSRGRVDDPTVETHLGLRELSNRDYKSADRHFQRAQELGDEGQAPYYYRVLALAYAGDLETAQSVVTEFAGKFGAVQSGESAFWDFVNRNFGLSRPAM